ncbi:Bicarbonate transport ATP-binding protein CmpD [Stieleria magnilauensis]|uniref:Bicarbonate transport ATP-binding protein CmpD n=2 Tax=Stieleria magnilauensis TaxID=2527963 RepID=A0ABX5XKK6_9BACT|nr:Bicarbonate transport ATP-binding protein CmpD [Planctomycetes bacterium TBK1r]
MQLEMPTPELQSAPPAEADQSSDGQLSVREASKFFPSLTGDGEVCVFRDVSLDIANGEFVSIIGHSGCGKSTLLNIIAGFDQPTSGEILVDGKKVLGPGLDRMVVFQSFALMPWMSAFDNVRVAVRSAFPSWDSKQVAQHTTRYLNLMGLSDIGKKMPAHLSGGMRQRVGLARAFAVQPKALLLDEPFAQIDALTRGSIQDELVRMWDVAGATVCMVTHDVDEAILLSDRIALMTNGPEARIAEIVDINIPRPRTREQLIESEDYMRLRTRILRFLIDHNRRPTALDDTAHAMQAYPHSDENQPD